MDTQDKILTALDVAKRLGCVRQTVLNLIAQGKFPNAYRIGNAYRIPESDVAAFLERARVTPSTSSTPT